MGRSKSTSFGDRENHIANIAKGLAHPARVAILEYLARRNTCMCGDIVDQIPLSQATVSQHLAELKRVGLIKGEIDGPRICYCIDAQAWTRAKTLLGGFLTRVEGCC